MQTIHVVGLGVDHREFTPMILKRVDAAEVLVGGDRLLALFRDHPGVKIPIRSPLEDVIKRIADELKFHREVVVLAEGDPGFFGIGKRLIDAFGKESVILYPNVTMLQAAASGIKIPWHNIKIVSLHGRGEMQPLFRALVRNDRIGVFTDPNFHPAKVAEELLQRGVDAFKMHVFEALGTASEKVGCFTLTEAAARLFFPLNFIILERTKHAEIPLTLGLDDDLYQHQKGLITKREIRAVSLSALEIEPNHTVWDLGAGCGSVAIESSFLAHEGAVLAVEKDPERIRLIRANVSRCGAFGVDVMQGEMPGCLQSLPDPDRVFIGGGIGNDTRVLAEAARRLKPGGKIVLNLVLMGSLARAMDYLREQKWTFLITQIQVSRSKSTAGDQRLAALNPVYILSAAPGLETGRRPGHKE
ncbi:MAG: precorrin-6y C5,15-methyltransferase (decarboxylating) subunit CbiE [Deltaproteobacteria bacterium]|nr:precorrin-6y C5,15-methyltransferase (decarboxylating) subunit CbiE [Deltaproteobacteria bacterium]